MSEDDKKLKKLNVKRESREEVKCDHDMSLMVDLLAGEITEQQQPKLSAQLDSCAICREKLEELSRIWTLAREVLDDEILPENVSHLINTENVDQADDKIDTKNKSNVVDDPEFVKAGEKTSKKPKKIKFAWLEIAASVIFLLFVAGALLPSLSQNRKSIDVKKEKEINDVTLGRVKLDDSKTPSVIHSPGNLNTEWNAGSVSSGSDDEVKKSDKDVLRNDSDSDEMASEESVSTSIGSNISKVEREEDIAFDELIDGVAVKPQKVMKKSRKKQSLNFSKSIVERKQKENQSRRVCESSVAPVMKPSVTHASESYRTARKIKRKVRTTELPMSLMTFHVSSKLFRMMGGSDKELVSYLKQLGVNNLEIERVRYDAKSAILIIRGLSLKEANRLQDVLNILKVVLERRDKLNKGLKVK